jgi:putative addiction module component (TIGR02574 family)
LKPRRKLQLVEYLWDDLAVAPEAVAVHDWQKQELARRKVNLPKNPASGLPWEEVSARCVPAMPLELVLAPEAGLDIAEALRLV